MLLNFSQIFIVIYFVILYNSSKLGIRILMKKIKLLDCTLRDGGSLNGWHFGCNNILNILQHLNDSNIEIVEIGFLQNNTEYSADKTIASSTAAFDNFILKVKNKKFKAAAMIDVEKYDISFLENKNETLIDGIRLMFKKQDLQKAVEYSFLIKEKGYSLSLNPVSITTYKKDDIKNLIKITNETEPDIIYIVDTYGLLNQVETTEYFKEFDDNLKEKTEIGYHPHNNLQLAFSNSIGIINNKSNRNLVIDGSLYGMGKRAGNANIELLSEYLNKNCNSNYDTGKLINIIETTILPLYKEYNYGYSLVHCIAAINKCHSDYVTYLKNNENLSYSEINKILPLISEDKKLTFDKQYVEEILQNIITAKH